MIAARIELMSEFSGSTSKNEQYLFWIRGKFIEYPSESIFNKSY